MHVTAALLVGTLVVVCAISYADAGEKKLQIGVKKRISPEDCKTKSRKGDKLEMHYTVSRWFMFSTNTKRVLSYHLEELYLDDLS